MHTNKSELEKQCMEMLASGVIRPSLAAFSMPVLLVKKSDDSWQFCVNYHMLNATTVKDMFPIPVVDELLDELNGATFFTKLDLRSGYHQVLIDPAGVRRPHFKHMRACSSSSLCYSA
jgi:hypothetical protein